MESPATEAPILVGNESTTWPISPWVREQRERTGPGFALQVFPIDTEEDPVRHLLAAARLAEALGFEAFFFGDHPAWGLECWVHMAAVALQTDRIRLGTMVNCVAYRHPVMLARLAADLDNLSGGRLILGIGAGWDENEFSNFGLPFLSVGERQAALEEAWAIVRGAWGESPFTFEGHYFQTQSAHIQPQPLQKPYPPLLIAGGGEKTTLRQVAKYADACNLIAFDGAGGVRSPEEVRRKIDALHAHCVQLGRAPQTVLATHLTGWLILAEDQPALQAKVQRLVPQGLERRFSGPWRGFAQAFTPGAAVDYYRTLAAAGIDYFIAGLLDATDTETIRLLAEEIAPRVHSGLDNRS